MYRRKIAMCMLSAMVLNQGIAPVAAYASPAVNTINFLNTEAANKESKTEETKTTEAGSLSVTTFDLYNHKDLASYNEVFKVAASNIASIRQNGGQYASSSIDKAIDGDFSTHWETGKPNSTSFTNEVVVKFNEADTISRLVYAARQDGAKGKGFATNLEIYVSETDDASDFKLLGTSKYTGSTGDIVEIKFEPTTMKQVKLVFKEAREGWASASEIQFYREDTVKDQVNNLFTNQAYMEVNEEYASVDFLTELKEQVSNHPLSEELAGQIDLAIEIVEGGVNFEGRVIKAEQYGDRHKHATQNLKFGFGNNYQPTGITALPGDTITIYVDVEDGKPLPKIAFSQQEGSFANWERSVTLKKGKNVIKVPEVPTDNWYAHSVTKGGPLYIYNPYTPEQQGSAPIIRFEGGERHPYLTEETDTEAFIAYLKDYKQRLDEDVKAHPNVEDRTMIDTFEFVTKHLVFTGTATGAYKAYVENGVNPAETVSSYTTYMENLFSFYGLDGSSLQNDPMNIRENVRLAQPFGALYAAGNHIGIQRSHVTSFLTPFEQGGGNWGLTHEIGHRMDVNTRLYGESTNNMLAMYTSVIYNTIDRRTPYESHIYKNVVSENPPAFAGQGFFERIGVFWQLEMYYPGYWARLNQMYRERNVTLDPAEQENSKQQYLIEFSSEILGKDLSEHFARHGFTVNDETKEKVSVYSKPEDKIWYLNTYAINYKGDGVNENTSVNVVKNVKSETELQLTFSVNEEDKSDVMGYEVYKDGKLVAFTSTNSYTDTKASQDKEAVYEVIAYGYDLSTTNTKTVSNFEPTLMTDEKITLELHSKFNPLEFVNAVDHRGEAITDVIVSHNVDTSQKGTYQVTYSITSNGYTKTETINVQVVSGYDSLSDLNWEKATTQWGSIRKNQNLSLLMNGKVRSFEKGFYAHANAEIVYNVSDLGYDTFEAYVGVDQTIVEQNNSSITFKFYADGTEVYNSGVMKHQTEAKFVSIDLTDVKELKIVVNDSSNGNTSDHGIVAATRLTTNNKKPVMTATNKTYKLGDTIQLRDELSASDVEDGDLTNKVEIVKNTIDETKTGRYEVVYRVTDSDGNTVDKSTYVTIYEDLAVEKSKYGTFTNLNDYNEMFKIPVASITNNGRNYGSSVIKYAIDGNLATHWETGVANSNTFKNHVIFDFGSEQEINRIAYAARSGGKGFATQFNIYVSNEESGDDFFLAGTGSYNGSINDKIVMTMSKTKARRVKFEFVNAYNAWASISEMTFYKEDKVADKLLNGLFTDSGKADLNPEYNTLEKLAAFKESLKDYPALSMFESDFVLAEKLIRAKFPTITIPKYCSTKVGQPIDFKGAFEAQDKEDGDLTNKVSVTGEVDFDQPGEYTITYTVTDSDGNTVSETRTIAVVDMNDYKYLSDYAYASTTNSYTRPVMDKATSGYALRLTDENGGEVTYEKGIGAHSTSTIVYDLTDKNFDYFTSYVGVDRRMFGSVGSVEFKVYVDGELQFNSGIMTSKQAQKYVEVDINGAKELKLVVTDGGNGQGSDHADWGDTKLVYANSSTQGIDRSELVSLLETVNRLNEAECTEETYAHLIEVRDQVNAGMADGYDQAEINSHLTALQEAYNALVRVDLTQKVVIKDKALLQQVKSALKLSTNTITVGDMLKLTSLDASAEAITSLEGLQYAKNLTSLNVDYNEITDYSVLSELKKLTEFSAIDQYVTVGMAKEEGQNVVIADEIIDQTGAKLLPSEVRIGTGSSITVIEADEVLQDGKIVINGGLLTGRVNSIRVTYEDESRSIRVHTIYMATK
ncbi:MAG: NPCBM/NEW2 domain-containing protein [bacterium]|nr:NPCBM/NEW2 domain-containing protein [bacterium]